MSSIIFSRYHSHCFFLTNVRWRPSLPYGSKSRVQLISPPFSPLRFGVTCSTNGRDDGFCGKGYGDGGVRRKEEVTEIADGEELGLRGSFQRSIWQQAKDIAVFAAPAGALWICGPMMSLIDTAVVGQSSSVELAALGPGTVVCDYMSYIFMFLSIATSNMVATSLARKDRDEAQEHISMLLFLALACGFGMLFLMKFFGTQILSAFIGPKNLHLIPAATSYIQIRGLAWPAVLVGMVAQSASLGMKDSFGPLKVLLIASAANGFGDIFLCCFFHHGIAGAAWATMVSQFIAAILMVESLNKSGFNALALSVPSPLELLRIIELAAPVFVTMFSKVAFYSLLTYFATSMGTITLAAHQVMIGVYSLCAVWGEPLSQTAQSFMPELMSGVNRSLEKARMLLQSLLIIGICTGCLLVTIGTLVPWLFPNLFTSDRGVAREIVAFWVVTCHVTSYIFLICYHVVNSIKHSVPFILVLSHAQPSTQHSIFPVDGAWILLDALWHLVQMQTILLPYSLALMITPPTLSLEGTLLAGRDLRFLSLSMIGCFSIGAIVLSLMGNRGCGLIGCWWALALFQWARFSAALQRLYSPRSILFSAGSIKENLGKLKMT